MPLHPQAIEAIRLAGELPSHLPPQALRESYDRARIPLVAPALPVERVDERFIGTGGQALRLRCYHPLAQAAGAPLMVFFHGGGWMLGSLESYDANCRRLASKAGCVVVSVDYRLAPEHRFPAAVDDACLAYAWAHRHAASLGCSPRRMLVCGDSAGGNLAAVVAQQVADDPALDLALQVLIYPCTDLVNPWPSYERNAVGNMLTTRALQMFYAEYVPDPAARADPRVSPMLRADLRGLAPALVVSAEFDPLVDENEAYAARLRAAGVATDYVCYPGMIHPFFTLGRVVDESARLEDRIVESIRRL